MTIFNNAYATRACSGIVLNKIEDGLEKLSVMGYLENNAEHGYLMLTRGDQVPGFYHPVVIKNQNKEVVVVADYRPYVRYDQNDQMVTTNGFDLNILINRATLNRIWVTKRPEYLRDVGPLAISVYCSWLSENISRKFALTPREQLNVAILAGIFYNCLFTDDAEWNDSDRTKIAVNVSKNTRCSIEDVFTILDKLQGPIRSVGEFCSVVATTLETVRIKDFNVGLLFEIIKNTWFGTNAAEVCCVAIEHPPTWLSLVYNAINERTFKKSGISQIVERSRSDAVRSFSLAVTNLLNSN